MDTPSPLSLDMTTLTYPGQQFSLDAQCGIFHGDCWRHELKDGQKLEVLAIKVPSLRLKSDILRTFVK